MIINKTQFEYFKNNWKLVIHLFFRTYHFGVNNEWWYPYHSIFGLPLHKRFHLIQQYKLIIFRCMPGVSFVTEKTASELFPRHYKKIKRKQQLRESKI